MVMLLLTTRTGLVLRTGMPYPPVETSETFFEMFLSNDI